MDKKTNFEAFQTLNRTRQTIPLPDTQLELFQMAPTVPQTEKSDYWFYSDLHNLFGETIFPSQPSMQLHAYNRIIMPYEIFPKQNPEYTYAQKAQFYDDHIGKINRAYKLGYQVFHNARDIQLSRYACWCFTNQRPHMIFARTYFLSPTIKENMTFEEIIKISNYFQRIYWRNKLSEKESRLSGIIKSLNGNFRDFYHQTSPYLYGGLSGSDIKNKLGFYISENETLLDYMGLYTLIARTNAIGRAIDTYNHQSNKSLQTLQMLLRHELISERNKMIQNTNRAPEQEFSETHAQKLKQQLEKIEKQFAQKYACQTIR